MQNYMYICIFQWRSNGLESGEQALRVDLKMWMEALEVYRQIWGKLQETIW